MLYARCANVLKWFALILAAAAVTLHAAHQPVGGTQAAALAIAPIAHGYAGLVLGLALVGTALLALPPLAGSAAHAAASSFGWPQGNRRDHRIAGVLVALMMASAAIALLFYVCGVDPVRACYWSALATGAALAVHPHSSSRRQQRDECEEA
ncbi:divalent metal cation transporter [Paraburkholderia heleia]|uniref:divalent metal cation transporter n=1 Tax=Paraburkholderia heleia TaxID=634127 RepID=UPI0005A8E494|nr:divalent metal cation transporter [Paraburkholderia heleia]